MTTTTLPTASIKSLLHQQRQFFNTGKPKEIDFRLEQLSQLRQAVTRHQDAILAALATDLRKPEFEAFTTEVGVLKEIDYAIRNLRTWVKPKSVSTPPEYFPARARIQPEPLGVVLIIGPWNYPIQLTVSPLVGAIAAGNCAIVKPSELAPATSQVLAEMIREAFDPAYITVVEGGIEASQSLLAEKFDHIFFTGGTAIGKIVMAAAAQHLTPVTLELGGKSPCIVDADIPVERTAKRIVWGKYLNAGQTCIAPDYLLVNRQIKPMLIAAIASTIQEFYGDDPATSPDYARIISPRHFSRLVPLLQDGTPIVGGQSNPEDCFIAPTVLDQVNPNAPVMQEEIFGPILPVLEYENLEEAIALINTKPKPLALYVFSRSQDFQQQVLQNTSSGNACVNDTIMQVAVPGLPFGGVGDSGIGAYHGKASFDTFSHFKSILFKPFWADLPWRYAPYADKLKQVKKFFK